MTMLEKLSKVSNAVLSPEQNCALPLPKHGAVWATEFTENVGELKAHEINFRKQWCKEQGALIGQFGAVLEVAHKVAGHE